MEYKDYDNKMTSMLDKIGNDSANLILDDVAVLLTDNKKMNEDLINKDNEIKRLNDLNTRLQKVNGNLLLQIPVQKEEKKETEKPESPKYNINEAFDEFGNFKR